MSRAQRRQRDSLKEGIVYMEVLVAHALHMDYGFGTQRINRVLERVKTLSSSITNEHMTATEMLQWCRDMKIKL